MNGALSPEISAALRSPATGELLHWEDGGLRSANGHEVFPVIGGIPILIDDAHSAFSTDAFLLPRAPRGSIRHRLEGIVRYLVPSVSHNMACERNYQYLVQELARAGTGPHRVLVVGGSIAGEGFHVLAEAPGLELVETDVAYGPRTQVICDGHALPFADQSFDAVVCQAVLEHVADPPQVAAEIHRVLRTGGLVYSEIPFMQQVHEGSHDFTRYTLIGHRRLFRHFDHLGSGVTAGPGTALAWSLKYLVLTLAGSSRAARGLMTVIANYLFFWLKYVDYLLMRFPRASEAASGTYFMGRRRERPITDKELLAEAGDHGAGFRIVRG